MLVFFRKSFFLTLLSYFILNFVLTDSLKAQSLEDLEKEILNAQDQSASDVPAFKKSINVDAEKTNYRKSRRYDRVDLSQGVAAKDSLSKIDSWVNGPSQIPFEHILVVKKRYIQKAGKHEVTPLMMTLQPGDSFRKQVGLGVGYTYHMTENFSFEALHLNAFTNLRSGFAEDLNENAGLEIERVEPVISAGAALQWAPFKGKSASRTSNYNFESYFFAGGGVTMFEIGSSGMAMFGLGLRMYLNRFSAFKVELRDYYDFIDESEHRLNISASFSILLGGGSN